MRILIIKLSSLGDLFHALPTVHNLKTATGAAIDWVTNTAYVDLVHCFDDVDTVIPFPRNSMLRDAPLFIRALRRTKYDMIIDLQGLLKSAIVARAARGKMRIGPSFHREGSHFFYDTVAGKRNKHRHAVIENLDVILHQDFDLQAPVFPVSFPPTAFSAPSPHIVISPASRWETKNWPADRFAEVARHLQARLGVSVTLLGAPADMDACRTIEGMLQGGCQNLAGRTSIVEMGAILKKADLLISNDSGPVHMAAAAGTPTLVVFGPTNPDRTGPFGDRHRVIQTQKDCQPCMNRRCKNPDSSCIRNVTAEEVIAAAESMLQGG